MSPQLVNKIAIKLSSFDSSQLPRWYKKQDISSSEYCESNFKELLDAYINAANKNNALMICIA